MTIFHISVTVISSFAKRKRTFIFLKNKSGMYFSLKGCTMGQFISEDEVRNIAHLAGSKAYDINTTNRLDELFKISPLIPFVCNGEIMKGRISSDIFKKITASGTFEAVNVLIISESESGHKRLIRNSRNFEFHDSRVYERELITIYTRTEAVALSDICRSSTFFNEKIKVALGIA